MNTKKNLGKQTKKISQNINISASACIVGPKEGKGPLANTFDEVLESSKDNQETWEKSESVLQQKTISKLIEKSGKSFDEIQAILAGDLLNQCAGSHYSIRDFNIPFLGLYGACSTMAESLLIGSMLADGNFLDNIICGTSSHFYSSERQFRVPIEYGATTPPTSQITVTGAGMVMLSKNSSGPLVNMVTIGKIVDKGIKDPANMGAAMAPAAVDTILAHFEDTGLSYNDYDLIVTGDLGSLGSDIVRDLTKKNGSPIGNNYIDCGVEIFDRKAQDVNCGGSGCGCSAVVLCGELLNKLNNKKINSILFVGTGALMSPTSVLQGESIPCIAHAVSISNNKQI